MSKEWTQLDTPRTSGKTDWKNKRRPERTVWMLMSQQVDSLQESQEAQESRVAPECLEPMRAAKSLDQVPTTTMLT